ncbi:bifunctional folylpolyglutamate synthase/dihydrofolate synthase [Pseudoroseicyclus tamaricis]|uniref:Dihydrofolate synthase/folylpolyglutamate synthase n=1 Tax=Pseudoroseicyclus tamaricis TaxID=2705421 RepID=A0A6B2JVZ6_9RHOB|nr:folylpolyglutamate synthase/dihydrofolate synthase family protein [Pseudoroseicyclus tamaricis]NDV02667.1 bifunctional folylpolyglutamate synthase/dihydrofolate synthase [Pseudoroseicyclus tamaricis]
MTSLDTARPGGSAAASQEASDALLERMMRLHPKVIDLTLERIKRLMPALGSPEQALPPIVHIAGTNGKGSTQAMIRAGLEAAGRRVHAYTSPHLARFHERIRLAGEIISEAELAEVLAEAEAKNDGANITYFEITTAAAYLAMSRVPADYALIEVGLGGRWDATNIFAQPRLTIITPVSIDHQQYLGDTLPEIASAKAGIIKRGVPCVVGPQEEAAMEVIEAEAARLGAPLIAHGQHWHAYEERGRLVFQDERGLLDLPLPNLAGAHQIQNAGAALAALRALGEGDAEAAVTQAEWPARMQRLRHGPLVEAAGQAELWLDGGHNPAGGEAVAASLRAMSDKPVHLICGMLNTKDIAGYLRPLASVAESLTAVTIPGEPNTLPAEETAAMAASVGLPSSTAETPLDAVTRMARAAPNARLLICGSLYLAGNVLRENG